VLRVARAQPAPRCGSRVCAAESRRARPTCTSVPVVCAVGAGSCDLSVVLVDETAESVPSRDCIGGGEWRDGWRSVGRVEVASAVGSLVVVVVDVGLEDASEMGLAEDEDAVEAFGSDGADESFGVGVGFRSAPGVRRILMSSARKTSSKVGPKRLSRSWTRNRIGVVRSSRASVRLRAICAHQVTFAGPAVTPPIRTRRVCRSMKNRTCKVRSRMDSTVKRSQAMIDDAWVRMNCVHVSRRAGGGRWAARMRRMLVADTWMPTLRSSPWMRR
jgi:hypothetical protein